MLATPAGVMPACCEVLCLSCISYGLSDSALPESNDELVSSRENEDSDRALVLLLRSCRLHYGLRPRFAFGWWWGLGGSLRVGCPKPEPAFPCEAQPVLPITPYSCASEYLPLGVLCTSGLRQQACVKERDDRPSL